MNLQALNEQVRNLSLKLKTENDNNKQISDVDTLINNQVSTSENNITEDSFTTIVNCENSEKTEHIDKNFIQFKNTCTTLFEKLTSRINNYYFVTKNGVNVKENNIIRNIHTRCSTRNNLGSANDKLLKMTKDQLSPSVNAQCLSPRPRPKNFKTEPVTFKKNQSPIEPLSLSGPLEPKYNTMKINNQDYTINEGDFKYIQQLGAGTCGTVNKMEHLKSKAIVAVKEMIRSSHPEDNKRISMDLEVLLKCNNVEHIVQCYGYLIKGTRVWIIMELMTTCLDKLLKKIEAPFPEPICGKIAVASIKSLNYLKTTHQIIHRDVKPSNILINEKGEIKLCDFGVSGRLVDSIARTKQGCEAYMAPERIQPPDPNKPSYDIRADVWSLGITLVQLALGKYPYQNCKHDFELLTKIIESDPPLLPNDGTFTKYFCEFIELCLRKDVEKRPKYKHLIFHPFILKYDRENVDVKSWFAKVYLQKS